jgi:hypothetical protein
MTKRATATTASSTRGRVRKAPKAGTRTKRPGPTDIARELEAARRRIRDLEELQRAVGARLDEAIATIHKILGRAA